MVRAEATLAVKLPAPYLELLSVQNGGYVSKRFDAFPTTEATSWADDHVWFRSLSGIGPADHWASVTATPQHLSELRMPSGLVLLSGDVHYWIALDYRGRDPGAEPSVVWFDNEMDQDLTLAPDFLTFVEGLVPLDDFDDDGPPPPTFHVVRAATGETYCGYSLEGIDWITEELVESHAHDACPDCLRLLEAWKAAGKR